MGGTIIEMDMVPASGKYEAESDKKSLPANGFRSVLGHADFLAANGISAPSILFDELSDTFYFAKNKPGKLIWGNRLLQACGRPSAAR
jgi:hypothetical protein